MHQFVSFNGRIAVSAEPSVSALASAALYAKGIFSTVAVSGGKPFLWEKHWRRLNDHSERLGIDAGELSEESTRQSLEALIAKNKVVNGRARITIFDESSSSIWPFETGQKTSLLITTAELRPRSGDLRLAVSPYAINSRSPLAGVKSCNYMEKIIALDEAKSRGFDEAVQFDELGNAASACMANIFWVKGGELFTPSLSTGCIAGTTREFVLENLECTEAEIGIGSLRNAEAVFLTSAGIGIQSVMEFDGRQLPESMHPITTLIR
ncbi:MAG: aminotransferase class IV [Acidobacteriota bacterium]